MSLLKQANHALRNGQYETAIRLYQQSLQDSPALAHIIQPNLKLAQSRHQKTGTAARQPSLPALPPKSSIDFAAMRVEDIISGAEQAMARDDWHSAYEHWNSLLTRPDEELSPQLLLRTSRELFKLDAFPQAAAALQRAATRNPQDPDVIREQAHQYYYHCYSSWLMLVTENKPDWYKADGLDKRPDWKTACELLEKAEKVSPRHNLRRYVQAYLLLAEDAWDKQNRTQAHAALDTALKAIGPNKLDQTLVQAIHTAVDQFRDGQVPENDPYYQTLQDQLKAMPLELLDVKNWLCLNDILNWNGLLLCGYVAREKAVDLALEQGKKENANKATLKTALKAALDRNDTKLADTYLGKLKRISPDAIDVRELDSCTELMKGNLDAFRQKWPHPPTPAEQRLRDYLKGKTVAVVGPAPTGTLDGEEIDRHDVVVRMNWRGQDSMPDAREFGSKTNISLYNAHTVRLLTADKRLEQTKSLDFRLIRRARHDAHQLQMIAEYPGSFYKSLNAVPAILFNLLLHGAEQIKLFKVTFYLGKQHHAESYRGQVDDGFDGMPLRGLQPVMANHSLIVQYNFFSLLKKNNRFRIDYKFKSAAEYAKSLTISKEMQTFKNKNILILSNGTIATAMAVASCNKMGISKASLVVFNKFNDVEFFNAQLNFAKKSQIFQKDISSTIFLNDETMSKITHEDLQNTYKADLIFIPLAEHWIIRFCAQAFPQAELALFEEGLGSYAVSDESNKLYERIKYAIFLSPDGLTPPKFKNAKNFKLAPDEVRKVLSKLHNASDQVLFDKKSALILGSSYSIYKWMSTNEELQSFVLIVNILIKDGYRVYFKAHPRGDFLIKLGLESIFGKKLIYIDNNSCGVEFMLEKSKPNIVLASISSSLFYLEYLFSLKCYSFNQSPNVPFNDLVFHTKRLIEKRYPKYEDRMLISNSDKFIDELVSIIVPAFNVAPYLEKCINSLKNQTYQNIEIIVINDGSTDETDEICHQLALSDHRVKYIKQENKGVSAARNLGYEISKGDYFTYVDGDDWVHPSFIEFTLNVAKATNADVVRNSLISVGKNGRHEIGNQINNFGLSSKITNFRESPIILTDMPISPCAGIYKKNSTTNLARFPEGFRYEDIYYYWKIIKSSKRVAYLDKGLYYYRKREGSATATIGKLNIDVIKSLTCIYDEIIDKNDCVLFDAFCSYVERALFIHLRAVIDSNWVIEFCNGANKFLDHIGHFCLTRFDYLSSVQYFLLREHRYDELIKTLKAK